ncbi:MAG TPA: sulfotransferase [Gemmatimonadales bacterium]
MGVDRPLFVVGTGRCGSTIFNDILTRHPDVCWLSRVSERYPHRPAWSGTAMRVIDLPLMASLARWRVYPAEAYEFWERCAPGFAAPCRDLTDKDVTPRTKRRVHAAFAQLPAGRRDRLLVKITGWPRMGFLKEVFPDARFVHVYRDGRAVANSWLTMEWFRGWAGPHQWLWGDLTAEQQALWDRHDRSFVALGAIAWIRLMNAFEEARQAVPAADLLEVSYERLCEDPLSVYRDATSFAELAWYPKFEAHVRGTRLRNANPKWQEYLTPAQQHVLEECLTSTLERWGYR